MGRSRFVVVKSFCGNPYVNIREYYQRKGCGTQMYAGKRGINLTVENWRELVKVVSNINDSVSEVQNTLAKTKLAIPNKPTCKF